MFRVTENGFFTSGNKQQSIEAGKSGVTTNDNLSNMEKMFQEAEKESEMWQTFMV